MKSSKLSESEIQNTKIINSSEINYANEKNESIRKDSLEINLERKASLLVGGSKNLGFVESEKKLGKERESFKNKLKEEEFNFEGKKIGSSARNSKTKLMHDNEFLTGPFKNDKAEKFGFLKVSKIENVGNTDKVLNSNEYYFIY